MWTTVSLSTHQVLDLVEWRAVAIYDAGDGTDTVALTRSGYATLGDDDSPEAILRAALRAFQSVVTLEHLGD
jgi:hypothetical protein